MFGSKVDDQEQFHEYLYGNTFVIYTDNNSLTYILVSVKLDATGHLWVASLANYNFTLSYHNHESKCRCGCSIQHSEGEA